MSGVVIVTGAGGDIGRAACVILAERGAHVVAVDRAPEPLAATVARVRELGGTATGVVADVTDPDDVTGYARRAAELGPVTGFFNNAGIEGSVAPLGEMSVADFDRVMAVNARGVFLGLSAVLPLLEPGGAVVNAASVAGLRGAPAMAAYVASKHAVVGLTKVAALEVTERQIRVNAVCPGGVDGRMIESLDRQRVALGMDARPMSSMGRRATPEDVARAVVFLLGPESGFVSGTTLTIDGGRTAV